MEHAGHPHGRCQRRLIGRRCWPVRSKWPCGRCTRSSLARNTTCRRRRERKTAADRSSSSSWRRSGRTAHRSGLRRDRAYAAAAQAEQRRRAGRVRRRACAPRIACASIGKLQRSHRRVRGRRRRGARMIGHEAAEEAEASRARRGKMQRLRPAATAIECSCCRRRRARSQRRADGHIAGASREAVQLQRIGRKREARRKEPITTPRIAPATRRFCRDARTHPWSRMLERRVIDVLADVVLVQAHRAVGRKRRCPAHTTRSTCCGARAVILDAHVPEPGRSVVRRESARSCNAVPARRLFQHRRGLAVRTPARRTARAEQRNVLGRGSMVPQVKIRGTPFEFVADEQVQQHVSARHAPHRAVGVGLDTQSGGTAMRGGCSGKWRHAMLSRVEAYLRTSGPLQFVGMRMIREHRREQNMKIRGAALTLILTLFTLNSAYAAGAPQDVRAQAREIFKTVIAFRTSEGLGEVPAMAEYLAEQFRAGGFPARTFTCCRSARPLRSSCVIAATAAAAGRSCCWRTWTS